MPEQATLTCQTCEEPLAKTHRIFAFQSHHIHYLKRGNTPDEQAVLYPENTWVLASFCSSACRKPHLGTLLEAQGLSEHLQHQRLGAGPITPCAKCGKPVDMTQPHGGWVKGKFTVELESDTPCSLDHFDLMAVVCPGCDGGWMGVLFRASLGLDDDHMAEDEVVAEPFFEEMVVERNTDRTLTERVA